MKKLFFLLLTMAVAATGQTKNLHASMNYAIFNTPAHKPYIETYLTVQPGSLLFTKNSNGLYTGSLFVEILFRKVADSSIVNFNKYALSIPSTVDTNSFQYNLLDVQRYALSDGDYFFELRINDKNSKRKPIVHYEPFSIHFPTDSASFSSLELLSKYSPSNDTTLLVKNGYELFPFIFSYYPESVNELHYYTELYRPEMTQNQGSYLILSYIRPFEIDKKMDNYFSMQKVKYSPVKVLLNTFDISDLPSGNYYLVVEARNHENLLVASQKCFFQRNNPKAAYNINQLLSTDAGQTFAGHINNRDTLAEYIRYLSPISTEMERDFAESQVKTADLATLQKYFYSFWEQRNAQHPQEAWLHYKTLVDQVNHDFKTTALKGYQTDRGRVYLEYGPPNVMTKSYNEPAAYPYEIWHYYQLDDQRNRKFVFYAKDLVTNDFQLIHSDAIGELANYRWQAIIYRRTWAPHNIDATHPPNAWGNNASDYYFQPR